MNGNETGDVLREWRSEILSVFLAVVAVLAGVMRQRGAGRAG